MTSTPRAAAASSTRASCVSAPSTSATQCLPCSGSRRSASSVASATTSTGSRSTLAQTRLATGAGPHRPGSGLGRPGPGLGPGRRLCRHQALQELLGAAHEGRRRVHGGHRGHALGVLLLSRLQTLEQRQMLPVPPALLGRLARRLAQVVAMQHHALAVEGQHDHRPRGWRPALRGLTRLVEGVEVRSRASHQLFGLTLGYLCPGMARQIQQHLVERARRRRLRHPAPHLERVTLSRQVQRRVERMQTVVTRARVAGALDIHRAEGRLQAAFRAPGAPSARHRRRRPPDRPPRPDCAGRGALAGACAAAPGPAGPVPAQDRSRSSDGLRREHR